MQLFWHHLRQGLLRSLNREGRERIFELSQLAVLAWQPALILASIRRAIGAPYRGAYRLPLRHQSISAARGWKRERGGCQIWIKGRSLDMYKNRLSEPILTLLAPLSDVRVGCSSA